MVREWCVNGVRIAYVVWMVHVDGVNGVCEWCVRMVCANGVCEWRV